MKSISLKIAKVSPLLLLGNPQLNTFVCAKAVQLQIFSFAELTLHSTPGGRNRSKKYETYMRVQDFLFFIQPQVSWIKFVGMLPSHPTQNFPKLDH